MNKLETLSIAEPLQNRHDYILVAIRGLFFGFVTSIGRYGKWYQPTALRDAAVQGMH